MFREESGIEYRKILSINDEMVEVKLDYGGVIKIHKKYLEIKIFRKRRVKSGYVSKVRS